MSTLIVMIVNEDKSIFISNEFPASAPVSEMLKFHLTTEDSSNISWKTELSNRTLK